MLLCKTCHAGCCRNFAIGLTGYDLLKISKFLDLDYPSFAQIIPVKEKEEIERQSNFSALFLFSDKELRTYYRFCLLMDESRLAEGTLKCMFLEEEGLKDKIIAKCSIYECRPLVCATFPSKFDPTEKQGIVFNVEPDNLLSSHDVYNLCPRKITRDDIENSHDEIMKNLILRKYEVDFFKNLADYWNRNPGTTVEFFRFLEKVYDNRVVVQ